MDDRDKHYDNGDHDEGPGLLGSSWFWGAGIVIVLVLILLRECA